MATEVGSAFLSIIPRCDGAKDQLQSALKDPMGTVGDMLGSQLGGSAVGALSKIAIPAAVVGIGAAVGKSLYEVGESFDSAYDSIKAGTGATGDALADLEQSFKNITGSVPNDMQTVADTMAELNTRTGATGSTLEQLSEQFLNLSNLGYDMDIDSATGMMTAWGVATDDMSGKLDELFIVSQSTGISMDSLSSAMSGNAASMQQLGFSFEDTASMAGLLDKAGLDASSMMSKMSKACTTLAKDGEKPAEAYQRMVGQMRDFISAGDEASAMSLASELFGTKGAAQFIQALETGALDLDSMTAALENADGAIADNEKSTRSAAESFEMMKNNALLLLEPLGSGVFETVSNVLADMVPIVQDGVTKFQDFLAAAKDNEQVQEIVSSMCELCATAFETLGGATEDVIEIWGEIQPAVQPVIDVLQGAFLLALDGLKAGLHNAGAVIEWFKDLFKGELHFPNIVLPHIRIDDVGELPWGIGGMGRAPQIGIDWYAKGGVFDSAQVIGIGEAGREAALPLNSTTYREIAKGIAEHGGGVTASEIAALREDIRKIGVYIDKNKLVGYISPEINGSLGRMAMAAGR